MKTQTAECIWFFLIGAGLSTIPDYGWLGLFITIYTIVLGIFLFGTMSGGDPPF